MTRKRFGSTAIESMTPRMVLRTVLSITEKSAMFAASVKSSFRVGVLRKAIWTAPIYVRVRIYFAYWLAGCMTYQGDNIRQWA